MSKTHTSYTGPTGMQPEGGLMEILNNVFDAGSEEGSGACYHHGKCLGLSPSEAYDQIIQWVSEQIIGEDEKHALLCSTRIRGFEQEQCDCPAKPRNDLRAEQRARLHQTNQEQQ